MEELKGDKPDHLQRFPAAFARRAQDVSAPRKVSALWLLAPSVGPSQLWETLWSDLLLGAIVDWVLWSGKHAGNLSPGTGSTREARLDQSRITFKCFFLSI
jgi:hypothetical protein